MGDGMVYPRPMLAQPGLGQRLRSLREIRGWSQYDLARLAGIARNAIAGIESGQVASPRRTTIAKLAAALQVYPTFFDS